MLNDIEKKCIRDYQDGSDATVVRGGNELARWTAFGLRLLLDAGRMVREQRDGPS